MPPRAHQCICAPVAPSCLKLWMALVPGIRPRGADALVEPRGGVLLTFGIVYLGLNDVSRSMQTVSLMLHPDFRKLRRRGCSAGRLRRRLRADRRGVPHPALRVGRRRRLQRIDRSPLICGSMAAAVWYMRIEIGDSYSRLSIFGSDYGPLMHPGMSFSPLAAAIGGPPSGAVATRAG